MMQPMSKSKAFLYFCLSFILGIAAGSFLRVPHIILLGILILGIILTTIKRKRIFGLCLLVLIGGVLRYQFRLADADEIDQYYDQELTFQGVIVEEPERRIDQTKLQIKNENIPGKILVTTELYPTHHYGDKLEITGKLRKPAQFDDFDYQEYLVKDSIYLVIHQPRINLIASNQGNWFYQEIFSFKDQLRKSIDRTLLPPQSSLLKAILLGDKYALSEELKEQLSITGMRHVTAVSGMHMGILSQILLYFALAIGLWRKHAFYFVLTLLTIYILMIGLPASAVRAYIMVALFLLAQKTGRLRSSGRIVIIAATVMLLASPLLLKSDVGFQLSFTAVLGLIYIKPILDKKLLKLPDFYHLKDILTMTLSVQIGTLPLLIYHFKQISLIAPIANILIVPVVSFIMIFGMLFMVSGLIYLPLAHITVWPVWLLLSYVLKVVEWLAWGRIGL